MNDSISNGMEAEILAAFDTVSAAAEATPTPAPEPVVQASEPTAEVPSEPPVADATTPAPAQTAPPTIPDDTVVEVLVDGQPVQTTWGEARKQVMMHKAFTQKTQKLAAEREELQRQRAEAEQWKTGGQTAWQKAQQLEADLRAMVQDPNKLAALYLAATGQQAPAGAAPIAPAAPAAPQFDPAQFREQLFQDLAPAVQDYIGQQQQQAQAAAEVTSFAEALLADAPVLKALGPDYLEQVYAKVHATMAGLGERSPAQAKEYIRLEIESTKQAIAAATGNTAKAAAVAKAQAAAATERGGSPVTPTRVEADTQKEREAQIMQFLDAQPA